MADEYYGYMTTIDGERIALSGDEVKALLAECDAADAKRRSDMPDTMAAIRGMSAAIQRLRDEGWSQGVYCPKDGREFAAIQFGSSGIFSAVYSGKWPDGYVLLCDSVEQPQGLLWKPVEKLTDQEREHMNKCMDMNRRMQERELRAFASMDDQ